MTRKANLGKNKDVCILIPCYNNPQKLAKCLNSINKQTYKKISVIIIDDNSKISYEQTINDFSDKLNIKYVKNSANKGALENMAYCLHYPTKTQYKIVFHEDDLMHPQYVEGCMRAFEDNPNLAFVGTTMSIIYFDSIPPKEKPLLQKLHENLQIYKNPKEFTQAIIQGIGYCFGSTCFRTDAIDKQTKLLLEKFDVLADRPMLIELSKRQGPCAFINLPLIWYKSHGLFDKRAPKLKDEHVIALYDYYKRIIGKVPTQNSLNLDCKITFNLIESYSRIAPKNRTSLNKYIERATALGLYNQECISLRFKIYLLKNQISQCIFGHV